ncbi:hypothetical protein BCR39DRAFT_534910 [Naematelia encephala]|uniref:Uncharacterized protein n=1 Tax=Naematelia encephala TaxID=71784 RepID=A0A1Y2B1Q5_9TREE|nr:hypothetical protein BCR39DRAFT_534910 [Naematelia encephala]
MGGWSCLGVSVSISIPIKQSSPVANILQSKVVANLDESSLRRRRRSLQTTSDSDSQSTPRPQPHPTTSSSSSSSPNSSSSSRVRETSSPLTTSTSTSNTNSNTITRTLSTSSPDSPSMTSRYEAIRRRARMGPIINEPIPNHAVPVLGRQDLSTHLSTGGGGDAEEFY